MPEEIDRTEVTPQRVEDEDDVGPEQHRMRQARQFHHQQEHQQADDKVLRGVGPLPPDRDLFELAVEMDESIDADRDIDRDDDVVGGTRQEFVEVAVLIHEQDLQDQRDREDVGDELLRTAGAGPEVPDQPDGLDHCEDENDVSQRQHAHQIFGFFARHVRLPRPVARRGGSRCVNAPMPAPLFSSRDQLPLPATFHLSFQALCSFRSLARPACTGTSGLALDAGDLHADEVF